MIKIVKRIADAVEGNMKEYRAEILCGLLEINGNNNIENVYTLLKK